MKSRGFALIAVCLCFFIFTTGLLVSAHFMGQRLKALKRLDRIEARIHRLHREDFRGKRKFWPSRDRPDKNDKKQRLSRRAKPKKQPIAIDFGGRRK